MIKTDSTAPSFEKVFIRRAIWENGLRLDGRGCKDTREPVIKLSRTEQQSSCEVQIGGTYVVSVVSGEIITPYPDRPVDGILQFNTDVSVNTKLLGLTHSDISRFMERSIRESESIDTESLCIIGGEKVWMINCDVKVLDASGGNVLDACMLAVMAALRAFRKPETSLAPPDEGSNSKSYNIIIHHSNEREPLPLALHHTPLCVSLGILRPLVSDPQVAKEKEIVFICDPMLEEDVAVDGTIVFSLNSHLELCAMNKPGGVSLTTQQVVKAADIASTVAITLHNQLKNTLDQLELQIIVERERQLEQLRNYHFLLEKEKEKTMEVEGDKEVNMESSNIKSVISGVDRNDPILQWSSLHQPAGLWNES